jgi:hypothetical protein
MAHGAENGFWKPTVSCLHRNSEIIDVHFFRTSASESLPRGSCHLYSSQLMFHISSKLTHCSWANAKPTPTRVHT